MMLSPWRIPDEFEIRHALMSVKQAGGLVVRTYTLLGRKPGDDGSIPRYVLGPGQFNEDARRTLDMVMKVANECFRKRRCGRSGCAWSPS